MAVTNVLVSAHAITTAQTVATRGKEHQLHVDTSAVTVEANFVYAAGGTTTKCFIQTTLDGTNWIDIMCFAFTTASARKVMAVVGETAIATPVTPAVDALADNTSVTGIIGSRLRARVVTTGTYTGTNTLTVTAKWNFWV